MQNESDDLQVADDDLPGIGETMDSEIEEDMALTPPAGGVKRTVGESTSDMDSDAVDSGSSMNPEREENSRRLW